ncbi:hypothetical protein VTN02DRAFT_5331 [Thermoascus thermophilus]
MMSSGAGEERLQPLAMAGERERELQTWGCEGAQTREVVRFVCPRTAMARSGKAWQADTRTRRDAQPPQPFSSLKEPFPRRFARVLHEVTSHVTLGEARWSAGARAKIVSDSTRSNVGELLGQRICHPTCLVWRAVHNRLHLLQSQQSIIQHESAPTRNNNMSIFFSFPTGSRRRMHKPFSFVMKKNTSSLQLYLTPST